MPAAEQPRPLPHAHVQRAPIARAYGGKPAYAKACALGHTQLDYDDWLTARTPAFKIWFGDWEAVRGVARLRASAPLALDGLPYLEDKKALENAFRSFGPIQNNNDGHSIVFPINTAGKIARHKGFDAKCVAGAFDQLFAKALPMLSEPEEPRVGHKVHIQSIEAYHHYVSLFTRDDRTYVVRFTVHQMQAGRKHPKGTVGSSFVHSSFISPISGYEKSASGPLSVGVWDNPVLAGDVALDRKLAAWLAAGKPENLRAPPNPQTGEPPTEALRHYAAHAAKAQP